MQDFLPVFLLECQVAVIYGAMVCEGEFPSHNCCNYEVFNIIICPRRLVQCLISTQLLQLDIYNHPLFYLVHYHNHYKYNIYPSVYPYVHSVYDLTIYMEYDNGAHIICQKGSSDRLLLCRAGAGMSLHGHLQ